jgi:hypothetical protein
MPVSMVNVNILSIQQKSTSGYLCPLSETSSAQGAAPAGDPSSAPDRPLWRAFGDLSFLSAIFVETYNVGQRSSVLTKA